MFPHSAKKLPPETKHGKSGTGNPAAAAPQKNPSRASASQHNIQAELLREIDFLFRHFFQKEKKKAPRNDPQRLCLIRVYSTSIFLQCQSLKNSVKKHGMIPFYRKRDRDHKKRKRRKENLYRISNLLYKLFLKFL